MCVGNQIATIMNALYNAAILFVQRATIRFVRTLDNRDAKAVNAVSTSLHGKSPY